MDTKDFLGKVRAIYIAPSAGEEMVAVNEVIALQNLGLKGDRYASKQGFWQTVPKPRDVVRDVSFINEDDIKGSGFTEAETRRNIVVAGKIDLISLIGKKFYVGEVLFEGSEECTPCKRPSDLSGKPDFAKVFKHTGGLRARVLNDGIIKVGDGLFRHDV